MGTVQSVCDNGDIRVRYSDSKVYTVNRAAVTKVRGDHVDVSTLYLYMYYTRVATVLSLGGRGQGDIITDSIYVL